MKRWACSMVPHIGIWVRGQSYIGWRRKLYSYGLIPVQLCEVTSIRLLLRVGIKVVDEWQISLDYVRGSNIYVRGYLDLRAWSLRLRTQTEENHYVKALFSSRERCFSLRRIRGILAIRRRACVSLRRSISGNWASRCLSTLNRDRSLSNSLHRAILSKDSLGSGRYDLNIAPIFPYILTGQIRTFSGSQAHFI